MRDWPVTVVANPIDVERWRPLDKSLAREVLDLPADVPLLLFGAIDGGRDLRKGFDLLTEALEYLRDDPRADGLQLVVFGQSKPQLPESAFPVHYMGILHDDLSLSAVYSAADAMVIPSRQDNLPNTGVEASACGTPVIAFDTGGLKDIVEHQRTGYLAKAFDTEDLANGIAWVLDKNETGITSAHNGSINCSLGEQARKRAVEKFSAQVVARQYHDIYSRLL